MSRMKYSPEIKEPTAAEAADAAEQYLVCKKGMVDAEKTIKNFARINGGFSHLNIHAYETAAVYKEMFRPRLVAEAVLELFGDDQSVLSEVMAAAFEKIDNRSWKGFVRGLNGAEHIIAKIAELDETGEGGCMDIIGSYSLDIRGAAPDLTKVTLKEDAVEEGD